MSGFQALRERRHAQWLAQLKQLIQDVVNHQAQPAPQIYLYGSRAGVIGMGFQTPISWCRRHTRDRKPLGGSAVDQGVAQDVIGLDQEAWMQLPEHPSVIWRHVARDAVSLLEQEPTA